MSRKRKLEDSDETENENNQLSASGDPHVVRYKIKRTRVDDGAPHASSPEKPADSSRDCERGSAQAASSITGVTAAAGDAASPSLNKYPETKSESPETKSVSPVAKSDSPITKPPAKPEVDARGLTETDKKREIQEEQSASSVTEEGEKVKTPPKANPEPLQQEVDDATKENNTSMKTDEQSTAQPSEDGIKPPVVVSPLTSPQVPLFNPDALVPQGNIQRTPFSSRKQDETQSAEKGETEASSNENGFKVDKLEGFPQLSEAASDSPAKVSSPSGSRPQSFPGEEKEEAVFSDFNAILLKCVNTSNQEEKPVFKYRQAGTGVIRVLKERDGPSGRVVFRQMGTWQVYLNSPLDLIGRVESTDLSTYFAVKFTALDAIASTQEKPKLAPFCVKLTDSANRNRLVSLLTRAK